MEWYWVLLIIFGSLAVMMASGIPVAFAFMTVNIVGVAILWGGGMGLSLLGAGESLSAAYQIRRAIALFPPVMETRIDLSAMMDAKVLDSGIRRLEGRLGGASEDTRTMLQFLATFIVLLVSPAEHATATLPLMLDSLEPNVALGVRKPLAH